MGEAHPVRSAKWNANLSLEAEAVGFDFHLTHGAVFEIEPKEVADGLGLCFVDRQRAAMGS